MQFYYICLAIFFVFNPQPNEGASVSLTVEGGVSLDGPHCPGTVRLFCEGVDLTLLRWRYNGYSTIRSFFISDAVTSPILLNMNVAFISVQLVEVSHFSERRANFSSVLTLDLIELQRQQNNIHNISCGDATTTAVEQVNISIAQQHSSISNVAIIYESYNLTVMEVKWKKKELFQGYSSSTFYTLNITGANIQPVLIKPTQCGVLLCAANISIFPGDDDEYMITLATWNESVLVGKDSLSIRSSRNYYFILDHEIDEHCAVTGTCSSMLPALTSAHKHCVVQYFTSYDLLEVNTTINEQYEVTTDPGIYNYQVQIQISEVLEVHSKGTLSIGLPAINNVKILYSSGGHLSIITVSWTNYCEEVQYTIKVKNSGNAVLKVVNISSRECLANTCLSRVHFTPEEILTADFTSAHLYLSAQLSLTRSVTTKYNSPIYPTSNSYYWHSFRLVNCSALQVLCFTSLNISHCVLYYYNEDSDYQKLESITNFAMNMTTGTVLNLDESVTTHYFKLSLNFNSQLLCIEELFVYSTNPYCEPQEPSNEQEDGLYPTNLSTAGIIGITSAGSICLMGCVVTILVCLIVILCRFIKKSETSRTCSKNDQKDNNNHKLTIEPMYEEIQDKRYELNRNEAYVECIGAVSTELTYYDSVCK